MIFRDGHDRTRFLERLGSAADIFSVRVHAYVLMSRGGSGFRIELMLFPPPSFPNRIDPIAILNDFDGRDQRTAEAPGGRDDGSVGWVTDRAHRCRFE